MSRKVIRSNTTNVTTSVNKNGQLVSNVSNNLSKSTITTHENLSFKQIIVSLFGVFLCLLLAVNLIRTFNGGSQITFTGFLNYLSNSPQLHLFAISDYTIVGDWGLFNFLKDFLNLFVYASGVSIWVGQLVFNCIAWIWYFIRFFFVV